MAVLRDLTLTGGPDTDSQYALIGHGDEPGDGDAGDTVSGDVFVRVGGSATLTGGFIGHRIDGGTYESGRTVIGVNGVLTADADSAFNSAPQANGGELRIYLGSLAGDLVDPAALLNGTPHGGDQGPNDQGAFGFALGPYVPNTAVDGGPTVDGNFAYYTLATLLFAAPDGPDGPGLPAFRTDVETLLDEIQGAQSRTGDPGGASFFTNELGEPFQTDVFGSPFGIGALGGPGGLQPAAGGTGEEDEDEDGQQQGPINLGDLQPAAGPGSQQAQAEDTCVAAYFTNLWTAAAACQ